MNYFILLILPLVSIVSLNGSPREPGIYDDIRNSSSPKNAYGRHIPKKDSIIVHDDNIRKMLLKGIVVAPRDKFPIQVGAFRKKSNADRLRAAIGGIPQISVRIIIEDDLYKVRISGYPFQENDPGENAGIIKTVMIPATALSGSDPPPAVAPEDTVRGKRGWFKGIKYLGESYKLVNALIITILFSIISMVILLIIILMNRDRMEREEKLRHFLMEKYQSLIVDYLFGNASPGEFDPVASDSYSRQILIDQMIDVSVNLKGDESKKLLGLYKYLGLDKDSLALAHDRRWHKKIKGFRELAFMNIRDANDEIYKSVNSTNEILRMEAQIALVRLNSEDHFDFLFHLKRPFSLWEQITLHDLIIQHNIPVPAFKKFLVSANITVVQFALRMIREFKQADAEEAVRDTLQHQSADVRRLAVQVAGDLGMRSTLEIMKKMYKSQDYKTCLEIVRSMGKMPDVSMMGFLKLVLDKEDDVQLQIEATKSIELMGEEGVSALVGLMKSDYKNYNIIIRHVLDRRIN
jgi:HEAT repeats/SPOR domain